MKKMAAYLRVSTRKQKEKGESLEDQAARLWTEAEKKGWDLTVYTEAISAKDEKRRPEFQRLLADLEAGRVDGLAVTAADRLWRDFRDQLNGIHRIHYQWGRTVVILDENLNLETPEGRLTSHIKGAVAQNMDPVMVEERLRQIPEYVQRFDDVFGPGGPWFEDVGRALAAFQSTVISSNVAFDRFMEGDETALDESAQRGFKLFTTTAGCSACHRGRLFTDEDFHSLGVPAPEDFTDDPVRQIAFWYQLRARGAPEEV